MIEKIGKVRKISIKCRGPVNWCFLDKSVDIIVTISKRPNSNCCSSNVECLYNTGAHGQRCKALHPWTDKIGNGISCPFSFDYPYILEFVGAKIPEELRKTVEEVMEENQNKIAPETKVSRILNFMKNLFSKGLTIHIV